MKLVYTSFYVEDIDKSADWFVKFYRAEKSPVETCGEVKKCVIKFDKGAEVHLYSDPAITEKTEQTHPGLGYHHVAINVGGDEIYEKLIKDLADAGYKFLTGPRINSFGGKEGIVIGEGGNLTIQTTPGRKDSEDGKVYANHIGFFVDDNKEFAKFYVRYFNAADNGCSPVNPKTGQDNYMVGFENGVSVELMTCPDMLPEPEDRYKKLGYREMGVVCNSAAEYAEKLKMLQEDGYGFLTAPTEKNAVILTPGNIAINMIRPE